MNTLLVVSLIFDLVNMEGKKEQCVGAEVAACMSYRWSHDKLVAWRPISPWPPNIHLQLVAIIWSWRVSVLVNCRLWLSTC
jgi:hypothetical protein